MDCDCKLDFRIFKQVMFYLASHDFDKVFTYLKIIKRLNKKLYDDYVFIITNIVKVKNTDIVNLLDKVENSRNFFSHINDIVLLKEDDSKKYDKFISDILTEDNFEFVLKLKEIVERVIKYKRKNRLKQIGVLLKNKERMIKNNTFTDEYETKHYNKIDKIISDKQINVTQKIKDNLDIDEEFKNFINNEANLVKIFGE